MRIQSEAKAADIFYSIRVGDTDQQRSNIPNIWVFVNWYHDTYSYDGQEIPLDCKLETINFVGSQHT